MNPHLIYLTNAFYIASALLGLPSLAITLLYGFYRLRLWISPPIDGNAMVKNPDAILLMLEGITRTMEGIAGIVGFLGKFIFGGLAIVAAIVLVLSIILLLTGRGLHAQHNGARVVAGLLMAGLLLISLLALASLHGRGLLLPAVLTAGSIYALWALWRGFAIG